MDPVSLLSVISAAVGAAFGADKVSALLRFLKRRRNYEDALQYRKEMLKIWKNVSAHQHNEVVKRIILHDKDIADLERVKKAYSMLSDDLIKSEIKISMEEHKGYTLVSDYFVSTIKIGKNNNVRLALNSGLMSSLLQNVLSATDRSAINQSTIVGMLVGKKMRQDTRSYVFLFSGIFLHVVLSLFDVVQINPWLIGFLMFMVGALAVNQKVMEYRIKYGLYGSTPYETREILKFIDEHTEKDDFGDGDGKRKIFQDSVEYAPKEVVVYGGAYQ